MKVFCPHHALDFFDGVGAGEADRQPFRQTLSHTRIVAFEAKTEPIRFSMRVNWGICI